MKGISVVIPNFNGLTLLPITLPTVFIALENAKEPYEVLVADDASTDDSINFLHLNFPQVICLPGKNNLGFSATANRGIREARFNKVLLLNSDVKLEPDYFSHIANVFDDPKVFGVMGRIIGWDDEHIQDGAKYPSFHNAKIKTSLNYLLKDESEMTHPLLSMYISGANAFMNREHFLRIGGLNEMFSPFYVEDYELSIRAWRLGLCCLYEHRAVCRHRTSSTIKSKSTKDYIKKISNRNKWFLHAIHLNGARKILWYIQLFPEVLIQFVAGRAYYLPALKDFFRNSAGIRKSREDLQRIAEGKSLIPVSEVAAIIERSVSDKELIFF